MSTRVLNFDPFNYMNSGGGELDTVESPRVFKEVNGKALGDPNMRKFTKSSLNPSKHQSRALKRRKEFSLMSSNENSISSDLSLDLVEINTTSKRGEDKQELTNS